MYASGDRERKHWASAGRPPCPMIGDSSHASRLTLIEILQNDGTCLIIHTNSAAVFIDD